MKPTEPFEIIPGRKLEKLAEAVLRETYLDFAKHGISKREIDVWNKEACWFPDLRTHPSVLELRDDLPPELRTGVPCEPQILWHLPSEYTGEPWPHIDNEPPWANGRKYVRIVGIALTDWRHENGAPLLWGNLNRPSKRLVPGNVKSSYWAFLDRGEILVLHPDTPHSRGVNRSGQIRGAVYFRFLEEQIR